MSINHLQVRLPRPVKPYKAGNTEGWSIVETRLGTKLPTDYKEFINVYGSGIICGFLRIHNPFVAETEHYTDWFYSVMEMFKVIEKFDAPLFPMPHGLLPCGRTENGGLYIVWKTGRIPDAWTIGLINMDTLNITYLEYSLVYFIARVIQGNVPGKVLNYADRIDCTKGFQSFTDEE
jgi:hypothetical protein